MPKQGLASIGITVAVNSVDMNYVTEISDIGGSPSELDATCFNDKMKHYVPGVQDTKSYEITYLFDNSDASSDFRVLKALETEGSIVPITITFPDGTAFASTGYVNTYAVGVKVDELTTAKLVMMLQSDWTVTNPA
ncbi:MAG: phage tail protein [Clostridiales bacterium]|nr:phage tail protein [Clostridiales bacterium]